MFFVLIQLKTRLTIFIKTEIIRFSLKIYFSAKPKVVRLVKHDNSFGYN
jgi:hypothetical protein